MFKILIVDDDPSIVSLVRESLCSEGFSVYTGWDGRMAFEMAQQLTPHLVIMDVNMPLTDGLQALKLMRTSKGTEDLPVILLTAAPSVDVYPALEVHRRVTYLKKPVDLEELHSTVRHFLRYHPRAA